MRNKLAFIIFLGMISLNQSSVFAASEKPVNFLICFDENQTNPYYMGNKTVRDKDPGVSVELTRLLEQHILVKVMFIRLPWKRCQAGLKRNKYDGIFNASFKEKRLAIGHYPSKILGVITSDTKYVIDKASKRIADTSRKLVEVNQSFYTLKGSNVLWDGKQLSKNVKVGVVHSYSMNDDLKKMGIRTDTATKPELNVRKLLDGKITIMVESVRKMEDMVERFPKLKNHKNIKKLIKIEPPFKMKPSYLMISKKFMKEHPQLSESIWDTIKMLNNSPISTQIYAKYF